MRIKMGPNPSVEGTSSGLRPRLALMSNVKSHVPYELSFTKQVEIADREQYFNECCVGGD